MTRKAKSPDPFSATDQLWCIVCLFLVALALPACNTTQPPPEVIVLVNDSENASNENISFRNAIAPMLEERCVTCHYDQGPLTGLSFQRRSAMLDVEEDRPILVPGDPEKSTLFLVTVMPDYFIEAMPPTGHRLSDREATNLYRWIKQGAEWPQDLVLKPQTAP